MVLPLASHSCTFCTLLRNEQSVDERDQEKLNHGTTARNKIYLTDSNKNIHGMFCSFTY